MTTDFPNLIRDIKYNRTQDTYVQLGNSNYLYYNVSCRCPHCDTLDELNGSERILNNSTPVFYLSKVCPHCNKPYVAEVISETVASTQCPNRIVECCKSLVFVDMKHIAKTVGLKLTELDEGYALASVFDEANSMDITKENIEIVSMNLMYDIILPTFVTDILYRYIEDVEHDTKLLPDLVGKARKQHINTFTRPLKKGIRADLFRLTDYIMWNYKGRLSPTELTLLLMGSSAYKLSQVLTLDN